MCSISHLSHCVIVCKIYSSVDHLSQSYTPFNLFFALTLPKITIYSQAYKKKINQNSVACNF